MRLILHASAIAVLLGAALASAVQADTVRPMIGGLLIEGYDYGNDIGPKGSIAYNTQINVFKGSYNGLKMPKGRRAGRLHGRAEGRASPRLPGVLRGRAGRTGAVRPRQAPAGDSGPPLNRLATPPFKR